MKNVYLSKLINHQLSLQTISDQKQALKRLNHNSYDILLLQDRFSEYNTLRLATMAYAMSRPTIVICNSIFKVLYYWIVKIFSRFFRRFKTSRKLIFFSLNSNKHIKLVLFLIQNHLQYFQTINKQIAKSTKIF